MNGSAVVCSGGQHTESVKTVYELADRLSVTAQIFRQLHIGSCDFSHLQDYFNALDFISGLSLYRVDMINSLVEAFKKEPDLKMGTLKYKLDSMEDIQNPNSVKVITDKNDYAIYFSRSVIPYPRKENKDIYYKHVGIYGYKREFVIEYSGWEQTPLEVSESLEQLRVLENGYKIKVLETPHKIIGVDTAEELEKVREYIKNNGLSL